MTIISRLCSAYTLRHHIAESRNRLYKVALAWCGSEMLADDLVQDTLSTAIEKCHQVRDLDRLNAWLYTVLNNTWRQYLRRKREEYEFDENMFHQESNPESLADTQEIVSQVRMAIMALPMDQRQVIALVDLEGFSYAEVAVILEIPIGTVMSRLHRARKSLQNTLEEIKPGTEYEKKHLRRVK